MRKFGFRQKNTLRCPYCGAEICTEATERHCYKCETEMVFIGVRK